MKKVLALVLSVLMVLSLSVVAFAADGSTPSDTNTTPGQAGVDNADKNTTWASAIWAQRTMLLLTNPALPTTTPLWTRTMRPKC